MFNAEKLLGGLLLGGTRRKSGLESLVTGGAGMVILGVAMEAIEHLMKKSETPSPGSAPPPPPGSSSSPPPPPPGGPASAPRPPPQAATRPAGASPLPPPSAPTREEGAVLLIRAMIAAANADGMIDQEERSRILRQLQRLNLTPEEQSFIVQELLAPASLEAIVGKVRTSDVAKQVYAVSLLAIEVDTVAERTYMKTLAERLGLDETSIREIHQRLGMPGRI
jgi:uncharacterized membrane protein YebE (DUF533 family)